VLAVEVCGQQAHLEPGQGPAVGVSNDAVNAVEVSGQGFRGILGQVGPRTRWGDLDHQVSGGAVHRPTDIAARLQRPAVSEHCEGPGSTCRGRGAGADRDGEAPIDARTTLPEGERATATAPEEADEHVGLCRPRVLVDDNPGCKAKLGHARVSLQVKASVLG